MATEKQSANISIRNCEAGDMAAIQRIYAHYVENSFASFEEVAPDTQEMTNRLQMVLQKGHPYIVAQMDGVVVGFAYASTFRARSAYRHTVENSIYVDPTATGKGIGSSLMENLINICSKMGFCQMIAVIGDTENNASINLHKKFGFTQAGILHASGFKFERWVDTVFMQRSLGDGNTTPI
ncbi:MAG: GNAT family N-acetyltransferase [Rhodospirillaceae bacterium]|nr:GNAT family N-acetyltransferase [Rhodospirillaceae bacterium]